MLFCLLGMVLHGQKPGQIYLSFDSGNNWQEVDDGFPESAHANDFVAFQNKIFVATEGHGIYVASRENPHWNPVGLGLPPRQKVDVLAVKGSTLFAGTYDKGIYISLDGGNYWMPSNTGLTNYTIRDIEIKGNSIYAGTNDGVFVSNDQGRSWKQLTEGMQINNILFFDEGIFVSTNKGIIASTDGSGENWKWIYKERTIRGIVGQDNKLFATAYGNQYFKMQKEGEDWVQLEVGMDRLQHVVSFLSYGQQLIACLQNEIYISYNQGLTWEKMDLELGENAYLRNLVLLDGSTLIVAVWDGSGGC